MNSEQKKERINQLLKNEFQYAYSYKPEETLEDVLTKTDQFKQVRLEAERAAMQKFRIENPNNETSLAYLVEKGMLKIWDLRDEI